MDNTDQIGSLMVVDDDEVDQLGYQRVSKKSGVVTSVVAFTRPEEAFEFLRDPDKSIPDLILLDIRMLGMSGFEFLDRIADEMAAAYQNLKVVMISTSVNPADQALASQYSAVKTYLNKQMSVEQLKEAVALLKTEWQQPA